MEKIAHIHLPGETAGKLREIARQENRTMLGQLKTLIELEWESGRYGDDDNQQGSAA